MTTGRMKDYKAKGRKVVKHGKEGSQPQEGRRMTMEWMKDYQAGNVIFIEMTASQGPGRG